jgi:evolved beta-galactosidase subunit alpha
LGPNENYADSREAAYLDLWDTNVSDMFVDYSFPQDNANHMETKWFSIEDKDGTGLFVKAKDTIEFSAWEFTKEEIDSAKHQNELKQLLNNKDRNKITTLNIDHRVSGLGSNSCGHEVLGEHEVTLKDFNYEFTMLPINTKKTNILELSKKNLEK